MFKVIKKAYRVACIILGRKKVGAALLAASALALYEACCNNFNFQKLLNEAIQYLHSMAL